MPHKRNPEDCEQIIVLAKLVKTHATACFDTMTSDHERDYRGIRIEWVSVTDASHYCLKALELTQKVLKNVVVEEKIMHDRVVACREQLCTECLMLELGKHIGKQDAFAILYHLSHEAQNEGGSLVDLLKKEERVNQYLSNEKIDEIFNPVKNVGLSEQLIARVIEDQKI